MGFGWVCKRYRYTGCPKRYIRIKRAVKHVVVTLTVLDARDSF
jgi:hypothetical protein